MFEYSNKDELIEKMISHCKIDQIGKKSFFDPSIFKRGSRDWVHQCLDWINIPPDSIPFKRICIHDMQEAVWKIEKIKTVYPLGTEKAEEMNLYFNFKLWTSIELVKSVIAIVCSELYMIRQNLHSLRDLKPRKNYIQGLATDDEEIPSDAITPAEVIEIISASMALGLGKVILNGFCQNSNHPLTANYNLKDIVEYFNKTNQKLGISSNSAINGLNQMALKYLEQY